MSCQCGLWTLSDGTAGKKEGTEGKWFYYLSTFGNGQTAGSRQCMPEHSPCSLPLLSFHSPDGLEVEAWPVWEALKAAAAPSEFQNLMTGKSGKMTKSVFNSGGFSLHSRPITVSECANLTKPGSCLRKVPGGGMKT